MSARRKAHQVNLVRFDVPFVCVFADQPDKLHQIQQLLRPVGFGHQLNVLGRILVLFLPVRRVLKHEGMVAHTGKPGRDGISFAVGLVQIGAPRQYDQRRALPLDSGRELRLEQMAVDVGAAVFPQIDAPADHRISSIPPII